MALPFFYINEYTASQKEIILNEETSKHIVQVLRMKLREQLNLTDGKGTLLTCVITTENKRHCEVEVLSSVIFPLLSTKITIAISLLKNANRFEWFLEKATEIGVTEIIPIICERTEKEKFRYDRMQGICISAMLQSLQCWLPVLQEPLLFEKFIKQSTADYKFIAHCIDNGRKNLLEFPIYKLSTCQICIGQEGDFATHEIELSLQYNCIPVLLGATRLRSETVGLVAALLLST